MKKRLLNQRWNEIRRKALDNNAVIYVTYRRRGSPITHAGAKVELITKDDLKLFSEQVIVRSEILELAYRVEESGQKEA